MVVVVVVVGGEQIASELLQFLVMNHLATDTHLVNYDFWLFGSGCGLMKVGRAFLY